MWYGQVLLKHKRLIAWDVGWFQEELSHYNGRKFNLREDATLTTTWAMSNTELSDK